MSTLASEMWRRTKVIWRLQTKELDCGTRSFGISRAGDSHKPLYSFRLLNEKSSSRLRSTALLEGGRKVIIVSIVRIKVWFRLEDIEVFC